MNPTQVKLIQDNLVNMGYMTRDQVNTGYGVYGPQTTAAVKRLQDDLVKQGKMTQAQVNTGYGTYGPQTTAAVQSLNKTNPFQGVSPDKIMINIGGASDPTAPTPENLQRLKEEVKTNLSSSPVVNNILTQNSMDDLISAYETGNFSTIKNASGQPFSPADQQEAMDKAKAALEPYYAAQQEKDKADTEAALAAKQAAYQKSLADAQLGFESEKSALDQTAANQGVLFSGGRAQKQQSLQSLYASTDEANRAKTAADIASTARDYQQKYGNTAANALSNYYNLGGNTYNAGVARGGVGSQSLSNIYNPSALNLGSGTAVTNKMAEINKRAAGLLYNKGNKILSTGYTNQY